jgi:hypothetical protein
MLEKLLKNTRSYFWLLLFCGPLKLIAYSHQDAHQQQLPTKYLYECIKEEGPVVHVLTLRPEDYKTNFIKAHEQVFGRETIKAIAERSGAEIAINAGFFEIGNSQDGMPSGSLLIDGTIFGLNFQEHVCLIYDSKTNQFNIQSIKPEITINLGKNTIKPNLINKLPNKNQIVLYTHTWGPKTLTPLKGRKEIAIDSKSIVAKTAHHGNLNIPKNGYVLSLPESYAPTSLTVKDQANIEITPLLLTKQAHTSIVMGQPLLIQNGVINRAIVEQKSSFYTLPHGTYCDRHQIKW